MSEQTLWDFLDRGGDRQAYLESCDRHEARRDTIKRLRARRHRLAVARVACTLPQPFTLNDGSVGAWRACPEFFGMKGYPYPDNHKVHYILYGSRGLIARGIIRRVSEGLFCIPEGIDPEAMLV